MELLYGLDTSEDNGVPSTSSSKPEDKQLNYILLFYFDMLHVFRSQVHCINTICCNLLLLSSSPPIKYVSLRVLVRDSSVLIRKFSKKCEKRTLLIEAVRFDHARPRPLFVLQLYQASRARMFSMINTDAPHTWSLFPLA